MLRLKYCGPLVVGIVLAGCATPAARNLDGPSPSPQLAKACDVPPADSRSLMDADCSTPAHSYSQADIARTGATTSAEALRLLDPSLTIRR